MQIKVDYPFKRILSKNEAADYCNIKPASKLPEICPVRPVQLHEAQKPGYDMRDLDAWIDRVKNGVKLNDVDPADKL